MFILKICHNQDNLIHSLTNIAVIAKIINQIRIEGFLIIRRCDIETGIFKQSNRKSENRTDEF
jgi:hypothetical protein